MKIGLISDLHIEYYKGRPRKLIKEIDNDYDVMFLAGDIAKYNEITSVIARTIPKKKGRSLKIFYVAGNHEYYRANKSVIKCNAHIRHSINYYNEKNENNHRVYFMNNNCERITINGNQIRVIGATLWTNFGLYNNQKEYLLDNTPFNDYNFISGHNSYLLTKNEKLNYFNQSIKYFKNKLDKPFNGKTFVLTHHLPSMKVVDKRYEGIQSNVEFASNLDYLFGSNLDYWMFGHTHSSSNINVRGTQLLCNPMGHGQLLDKMENTFFNPNFVVNL